VHDPLHAGAHGRGNVLAVTEEFVLVDRPRPGVALVTLNRPPRMNAMAFDVMIPLRDALRELSTDNQIRVVVLTGAGRGFCSGADLEDAGVIPNIAGLTKTTIALRAMELLDDVIISLRRMHQPVIGAINGAAIGGGMCLALATDVRVASDEAYFRAAGINNGLTSSELGLSYLLPRAIGSSRAFEIMLTGRDVDAAEADRIGLVSSVVAPDQLLESCYDMASRIIALSRVGVETTKRMLWSSLDASSLTAHMDHEGYAQLYVRLTTQNFEEAVLARREGRSPIFRD
jgi:enoyl-CoA hydratase